ncbi:hypothetical protein CACET_c17670 [Clostridium aceticum]|uniref:DUF11 domain-containing protein n=1 Tax=Clostridium aceticum TaxID=84022 RepID=A0A0G3WBE7_9CLOT|nr:hypothetical protein [Clostridium aceticum]AKL95215.1 hypothetical protein CACET_c17670 [Clostridium aceticum]
MPQPWPTTWRPYTKNGIPLGDPVDESPPSTDIVGNTTFPAVFFQFDGTAVFFRMRLNTTPISGGSLVNFNWGVLFDTNNTLQTYEWLVTVNGQGNTIEIWENFINSPINSFADAAEGLNRRAPFVPNYSEAIVLGSNVRVVNPTGDGSNFGGNPDVFLDFQVPWNVFSSFLNITEFSIFRMIYYTATSNRNANKDIVGNSPVSLSEAFGDNITSDPAGPQLGDLLIAKTVLSGPVLTNVNTTETWSIQLNASNPGNGVVNNVQVIDNTLLDQVSQLSIISQSKGSVLQVNNNIIWDIGDLAPGENAILVAEVSGSFATTGLNALDEAIVTGSEPVLGNITAGPSTGVGIDVLPAVIPAVPVLAVEKFLTRGPSMIAINTEAAWEFTVRAQNTGTGALNDVIITDTILLGRIMNIRSISVDIGSITIDENVITWHISTLNPEETALATFEVMGTFQVIGERALNRVIAVGTDPVTGDVISSNPVAGVFIHVTEVPLPGILQTTKRIISGPFTLVQNQQDTWVVELLVVNIGNSPINDVIVIDDILLFNIGSFNINSISKGDAILTNQKLQWNIGGLNPQEVSRLEFRIEGRFSSLGLRSLNGAYAQGTDETTGNLLSSNFAGSRGISVIAPQAAEFFINNRIISGPLTLEKNTVATWQIEIAVENTGNIPLLNVEIISDALLDTLTDISVVSLSRGTVDKIGDIWNWQIGTLNPGERNVLVVEIAGSFDAIGSRFLLTSTGNSVNSQTLEGITTGPISVLPIIVKDTPQPQIIQVENQITSGPIEVQVDQVATWVQEITVTNTGDRGTISHVLLEDTFIIGNLVDYSIQSITRGNVVEDHGILRWFVDELNPGETIVLIVEVTGSFRAEGRRVLARDFARGINPLNFGIIRSSIVSTQEINVLPPIPFDFESICILEDKVYASCQQRHCFEKLFIPNLFQEEFEFVEIKFNPGKIIDGSLIITPLKDSPNFARVRFDIMITFRLKLKKIKNNKVITFEHQLPIISKDIILFMPETRDEFKFEILVETASQLLVEPTLDEEGLRLAVGVFIIIKVVGKVQLFIPAFGFCPEPPDCEEFLPKDICEVFSTEGFPAFYPQQEDGETIICHPSLSQDPSLSSG